MEIIVPPTTERVESPVIEIPPGGHVVFGLHGLNIGDVTVGHKIEVLVDSEWFDHLSWPSSEPTIIVYGSSENEIIVRAVKTATRNPIGIRVA